MYFVEHQFLCILLVLLNNEFNHQWIYRYIPMVQNKINTKELQCIKWKRTWLKSTLCTIITQKIPSALLSRYFICHKHWLQAKWIVYFEKCMNLNVWPFIMKHRFMAVLRHIFKTDTVTKPHIWKKRTVTVPFRCTDYMNYHHIVLEKGYAVVNVSQQ